MHNTQSDIIVICAKVDRMFPTKEACAMQDMFCFAVLADANTSTIYTDLYGTFPVRLFKNMQYIFIAYIYDLNAIIVCSMPSHTNASMIATFTEVFAILRSCDYHLALNVMDTECSKATETHICTNKMTIQLVPSPPHNHRVNVAKRAITTFKEHFLSALATVEIPCPLQLQDESLSQVELTLNLLRFSNATPKFLPIRSFIGHSISARRPLSHLAQKH